MSRRARMLAAPMLIAAIVAPTTEGVANANGMTFYDGGHITIDKIDASSGKHVTGDAMDSMTLEIALCNQWDNEAVNYRNVRDGTPRTYSTCDAYEKDLNAAGDDPEKLNDLGVYSPLNFSPRHDGTIRMSVRDITPDRYFWPEFPETVYIREGNPPKGYERNTTWQKVGLESGEKAIITPEGETGYVDGGEFITKRLTIKDTPGTSKDVPTPLFESSNNYTIHKVDDKGMPVVGAEFETPEKDWDNPNCSPCNWYHEKLKFVSDASGALIVKSNSGMNDLTLEEVLRHNGRVDLTETKSPDGYSMSDSPSVKLGLSRDYTLYVNPITTEQDGYQVVTGGEAVDKYKTLSSLKIVNAKDEVPASSEETAPSSQPSSSSATSPSNTSGVTSPSTSPSTSKSTSSETSKQTSESSDSTASSSLSSPGASVPSTASQSVPMAPHGGTQGANGAPVDGPDVSTGGDVESESFWDRVGRALSSIW